MPNKFRKFRSGSAEGTDPGGEIRDLYPDVVPVLKASSSVMPSRSHSTSGGLIAPQPSLSTLPGSSSCSGSGTNRTSETTRDEVSLSSLTRKTALFRDRLPIPTDPLGLVLIHDPGHHEADIIFVHGLGGSSRKTWSWNRDTDIFWPSWIHHEEGLSHFRIFSFGYDANFRDSDTPLSILDFSKSLLVRMRAYGQGVVDSASIGLVCAPPDVHRW